MCVFLVTLTLTAALPSVWPAALKTLILLSFLPKKQTLFQCNIVCRLSVSLLIFDERRYHNI